MMTPMSRLAALVTSSASAPISCEQPRERAPVDRPRRGDGLREGDGRSAEEVERRDDRTGDCGRSRADAPERRGARHGPRVPRRVPAIERDQPGGWIVALDDARPAAVGVEPIKEFRREGRPPSRRAAHRAPRGRSRSTDTPRAAAAHRSRPRRRCWRAPGREGAGRHEPCPISRSIRPQGHRHRSHLLGFDGPRQFLAVRSIRRSAPKKDTVRVFVIDDEPSVERVWQASRTRGCTPALGAVALRRPPSSVSG